MADEDEDPKAEMAECDDDAIDNEPETPIIQPITIRPKSGQSGQSGPILVIPSQPTPIPGTLPTTQPTDKEQTVAALIAAGRNWRQIHAEVGCGEKVVRRIAKEHNLILKRVNKGGKGAATDVGEAKAERPEDYAAGAALKDMALKTANIGAAMLSQYEEIGKHAIDQWESLAKLKCMSVKDLLHTGMNYYVDYGGEVDRLRQDRDEWKELAHLVYSVLERERNRSRLASSIIRGLIREGVVPSNKQIDKIHAIVEAIPL